MTCDGVLLYNITLARAREGGNVAFFSRILRVRFVSEVKRFSLIMPEDKKRNLKRRGEPLEAAEMPSAARGAGTGAGWLQDKVAVIRRNSAECQFNMKRLRFLSDAQNVRQVRGAVLYWMARDQRVQGNYLQQEQQRYIIL